MEDQDDDAPQLPYEVRETEVYLRLLGSLGQDIPSLDERLQDLIYAIARVPLSFPMMKGGAVFYAHHDGDPPLRICYAFNNKWVTLLLIERVAPDDVA